MCRRANRYSWKKEGQKVSSKILTRLNFVPDTNLSSGGKAKQPKFGDCQVRTTSGRTPPWVFHQLIVGSLYAIRAEGLQRLCHMAKAPPARGEVAGVVMPRFCKIDRAVIKARCRRRWFVLAKTAGAGMASLWVFHTPHSPTAGRRFGHMTQSLQFLHAECIRGPYDS